MKWTDLEPGDVVVGSPAAEETRVSSWLLIDKDWGGPDGVSHVTKLRGDMEARWLEGGKVIKGLLTPSDMSSTYFQVWRNGCRIV